MEKSLKILLKVWNQKLEDSGFEDAEIELKTERRLKQKASNVYRQAHPLEREIKLEYFLRLGFLAHNANYPNDLEKIIMVNYSEGASIKKIIEEINKNGYSRDRRTIRFIIRRWQTKWKIKIWSPSQMNLKKPLVK